MRVTVEVGVRELRENLAEWLDRAAAGEEILVTERGKPKAVPHAGRVGPGIDWCARAGPPHRSETARHATAPGASCTTGSTLSDIIIEERAAEPPLIADVET